MKQSQTPDRQLKVNFSQKWESEEESARQIHNVERNIELKARLTAHPFLIGMSPHHIQVLTTSASVKEFQEDEIIFRAGQPANGFYLIQNGSVAIEGSVFEHGAISTDFVSAGEPLGWSWLFPPYLWHYDARNQANHCFFSTAQFCTRPATKISLLAELFKRMSEVMVRRLRASRARLIEALKPAGTDSDCDSFCRAAEINLERGTRDSKLGGDGGSRGPLEHLHEHIHHRAEHSGEMDLVGGAEHCYSRGAGGDAGCFRAVTPTKR